MPITAAFDTTVISLKSSIFGGKLLVSSKLRNKGSFHLSQKNVWLAVVYEK